MKTDMIPSFMREILVAFSLLTRLPLPPLPDAAFDNASRSVWAYPLVGAALGVIAGGLGTGALLIGLPASVAAGLTLAVFMITTGAMHEDGLADTADGFWGAFDRDRRLEIMKDSQIGTYGTLSLGIITGLRWAALATVLPLGIAPIVAAACLSRAAMPVVMHYVPHARRDGLSHSVGQPSTKRMLAGGAIALVICGALMGLTTVTALLLAVAGLVAVIMRVTRQKIGGQTGDVLGATQLLTELLILLICLVAIS